MTELGLVTTFVKPSKDLNFLAGIAHNQSDNSFAICSHFGHVVQKVTSGKGKHSKFSIDLLQFFIGSTSVLAGSGSPGCIDGVGIKAKFSHPCGIAIDQQTGNMFITELDTHIIRKITPQGLFYYFKDSR